MGFEIPSSHLKHICCPCSLAQISLSSRFSLRTSPQFSRLRPPTLHFRRLAYSLFDPPALRCDTAVATVSTQNRCRPCRDAAGAAASFVAGVQQISPPLPFAHRMPTLLLPQPTSPFIFTCCHRQNTAPPPPMSYAAGAAAVHAGNRRR